MAFAKHAEQGVVLKVPATGTTRFVVTHVGLRLRVDVLDTVREVDKAYLAGCRPRKRNWQVHAFFEQFGSRAKHFGRIVLPADGNLAELVPHEVAHAVIRYYKTVSCDDDERVATAIGLLSAKIQTKLMRLTS